MREVEGKQAMSVDSSESREERGAEPDGSVCAVAGVV